MDKKTARRNLRLALFLIVLSVGMTFVALGYIQFFHNLPR